jgi:anti-anti-sigma factor
MFHARVAFMRSSSEQDFFTADVLINEAQRGARARRATARGTAMEAGNARTRVMTRVESSVYVLGVEGGLTLSADAPLIEAYAAATTAGARRVVLDFAQATAINSAGVALIIQIANDCSRHKQVLAFSGLTPHFNTLFQMVGLAQYGGIYATEAEACAALGAT